MQKETQRPRKKKEQEEIQAVRDGKQRQTERVKVVMQRNTDTDRNIQRLQEMEETLKRQREIWWMGTDRYWN